MATATSLLGTAATALAPIYQLSTSYPVIKTLRTAASMVREVGYFLSVLPSIVCGSRHHYHLCDEKVAWKTNSQGLYVLIHGLKGHPSIWNGHITELKKQEDADLFVPRVPHAGNCSLEEAAIPILNQLLDYIKQHPKSPVCLIGVSNGARLALWLEVELRKRAGQTAVKVSNIAGIHLGSSRIDLVASYRCTRRMYKPAVLKELALNSPRACALIAAVKESFGGKREYEFFASTEDLHIPETESSLPVLGKGERHNLVSGYAHSGIVGGVRQQQLASCTHWMKVKTG